MFHGTEMWCKIWSKAGFEFGKWHEELSKFWPKHSKVSKFGLWWDSFIQSRECVEVKFEEELWRMKGNEEWGKVWGQIDL